MASLHLLVHRGRAWFVIQAVQQALTPGNKFLHSPPPPSLADLLASVRATAVNQAAKFFPLALHSAAEILPSLQAFSAVLPTRSSTHLAGEA